MTTRPSNGLAGRLRAARKAAGLTAQELSDRTQGQLSRGVIANIENERKVDVTVDDLISLAWALDVPLASLALPVDQPASTVTVQEGPKGIVELPLLDVLWWMTDADKPAAATTSAGPIARERVRALLHYRDSLWLAQAAGDRGSGSYMGRNTDELRLELGHARYELERLGIDVSDLEGQ